MSKRAILVGSVAAVVLFVAFASMVSAQSPPPGPDYFTGPLAVQPFSMPLLLPQVAGLAPGNPGAHARGFQPFVRPLTFTPDNWLGGAGNWNTGALWSTGALPTSSNDVYINDSTPAAVVSLNVNATIDNLTIGSVAGSTSRLSFNGGASLTIDGTTITNLNDTGPLGGITLNSSSLVIGGPVTLTGGGIVDLNGGTSNLIYGAASADVLTNLNNTIQGSGNIGNNSMGLVNQGTIDANIGNRSDALTIQTSSGTTNSGILEATAGGNLILNGGAYNNAGGTILASGDNGSGILSIVTLQNATITGGTLSTVGDGLIQPSGTPTLNGVTIDGIYQMANGGNNTTFEGTIANTGLIQTVGCCGTSNLILGGASVTLTGGGTVSLGNSGGSLIYGAAGTDVLTNVNNTIQGFGNIGDNSMGLVNQGTIDANIGNRSDPLTIQTSSGTTNSGILEATAGGNLILNGGAYNNAGGTILASGDNGSGILSIVTLQNATINGGTLSTAGDGLIQPSGNPTLNGVTIVGTYQMANGGNNTTLEGTIANTGLIQTTGCCGSSNLTLGSANVTLTGGGTVSLGNSGGSLISGAASSDVLTNVNNTIEGFGNIGNGAMGLINGAAGTILANQSTELFLKPSAAGFTNNGTVQANTGSTLDITGGVFTNFNGGSGTLTGGTYNANGGTLQFDNANIVTNAADIILTGVGSQIVSNTNANALANFATNAAGGVFQLGAGRSFTTSAPGGGNFTNSGTLVVGGGDTFNVSGALSNFAGTTLTGGVYYVAGTLQFGASGSSLITNDANLTLAGNGAKLLDLGGNNLLTGFNTNAVGGTFTVAAGGSYTTPGDFSNSGTMDLEQGSALKVAGNLNNNGIVTTNGQNLGGGANTLTVTGTLANNTGDTVTLGANNDTSDVANVGLLANSGTVTVDKGANLNLTSAGADTNSSAIAVNGGTLDVQAGSLTNSGILDLEQRGTLMVTGNLTNTGTLTTNTSNLGGGANTITVTGTLTNDASDTVTIGAHGDTTDTASVGLLANAGTITVDKGASLKLTATGADSNTGAIALDSGTMTVASGGVFTNSGTLDEEGGGKLSVTGNMTNAGTLTTNASNQGGAANSITVSGKLTNSGSGTATIGDNNDTSDKATVETLANSGTITVDTGATLTLSASGSDTNAGAIAVTGTLDIDKAATLSGAGAITLTGGAITGMGGTATLDNKSTIQGSGTISNLGITNSGTLSANQAAALIILPTAAGLDNTGTIKVSAGDAMQIGTSAGGALTNFSGATLTGGIYSITGTLQFGASGATIATNAANITLNGTGEMVDFSGHNILAGFNNNASTGVFKLASAASLTTTGGSFTNAGLFTVSTGTTFTVGGSSFNFTQTGGTSTIDGTLSSSTVGTISLNGGTLDGAGTLGDNVLDDSTLSVGDSAAKTGQLKVADTYMQGSTGTLDIVINGATLGAKYDQLKVTQGATLSGTLNIDLGSFTPTVGQKFTILTASSVTGTFTTVNGLAINGTEHFTITYDVGSVVLTVVSGALPTSNFGSNMLVTQLLHPPVRNISAGKVRYGLSVSGHNLARVPAAPVAGFMRTTPVAGPSTFGNPGTGMHGFRPMDSFGSTGLTSAASAGDPGASGAFGTAPVSASSYNSMSGMNHMRFECGVDLKGLLKTSRKRLIKGLWASPDSPDALYLGYMTYTTSH